MLQTDAGNSYVKIINTKDYMIAMTWDIDSEKCMRCGACVGVCPVNALTLTEHGIGINKEKCISCGNCSKVCPVHAIKVEK